MSDKLGLVELLLVLGGVMAWGIYELRSLKPDRNAKGAPPAEPRSQDPPTPEA